MLRYAVTLPRSALLLQPKLTQQRTARSLAARSRPYPVQAALKPLRGAPIEPVGGNASMGKGKKAASQGNANTQAYIQVRQKAADY